MARRYYNVLQKFWQYWNLVLLLPIQMKLRPISVSETASTIFVESDYELWTYDWSNELRPQSLVVANAHVVPVH